MNKNIIIGEAVITEEMITVISDFQNKSSGILDEHIEFLDDIRETFIDIEQENPIDPEKYKYFMQSFYYLKKCLKSFDAK